MMPYKWGWNEYTVIWFFCLSHREAVRSISHTSSHPSIFQATKFYDITQFSNQFQRNAVADDEADDSEDSIIALAYIFPFYCAMLSNSIINYEKKGKRPVISFINAIAWQKDYKWKA